MLTSATTMPATAHTAVTGTAAVPSARAIAVLAAVVAAVAAVAAVRRRPDRAVLTAPWLLVTASLGAWAISFAARELLPEPWRLPGLFAGHGVALMLLAVGVVWLTWRWAGPDPIPALDALILTAGFGLMAVVAFVPPMVAGAPLSPVFVWLIATGGLMLGAALTYLVLAGVERTRSAVLLAWGAAAALAATVAAETRLLPGVADSPILVVTALHLITVVLIAAAVASRAAGLRTPPSRHQAGTARLLLLGAGAAVGPGLIVVELATGRTLPLVEAWSTPTPSPLWATAGGSSRRSPRPTAAPSCCSTSTGSPSSATRSARGSPTRCCEASLPAWRRSPGRTPRSPGSALRSSGCSSLVCRTPTPPSPPPWPRGGPVRRRWS